MLNSSLIIAGKILSKTAKVLNVGHGSTWPGHIALKINKNFISQLITKSKTKVIIVAGTNGKTTTSKLIAHILEETGNRVLQNESGANLLNGIASTLLLHSSISSKLNYDYAIFEVDENALPHVLKEVSADFLVLLNLFRDQLDRYGEVNTIAGNWRKSLHRLPEKTTLILNADDPQIAHLGSDVKGKKRFFASQPSSPNTKIQEHAADSTYCPKCGEKLHYTHITFSHLGAWKCPACGLHRPTPELTNFPYYPLSGLYNQYNAHAAILTAESLGYKKDQIKQALQNFKPAFGRQEELTIDGKHVRIFLSKNPTSFNESLRTIKSLNGETILFILNDRVPDGHDVSWIWDTDIENILDSNETIFVSGDRVYDMAVRLKYATKITYPIENLSQAIHQALASLDTDETLYIIPTYSAMLESRKILTGKKIL
jgi:lipid II isoglutaminyl synthase (glutamine-hydrolysing)